MGIRDWFGTPTVLQLALKRGMQPEANLQDEVHALGDYKIQSHADAEAICNVLERLISDRSGIGGDHALHAVTGLFQDLDGYENGAGPVLAERGIPLLASIVQQAVRGDSHWRHDDVLFILKMCAMYGTRVGVDAVISAARVPLEPTNWFWTMSLRSFNAEHPYTEYLFQSLSNPLPSEFIGVSLLDAANAARIEGAAFPHPFDSPQGIRMLEQWMMDSDPDHFSYAHSATAALPFIGNPARDRLLAIVLDHPDPGVQMEGAWAAAKLQRESGVRLLSRSCLDVNRSKAAMRYLTELGREDAIPEAAKLPDFVALAEFAQWLAHPSELGRAPDELRIIDHRTLAWPPEREEKPFWLIEYRARDQTGFNADDIGVGLVGSVTFCLFSYDLDARPPEDGYAIHCTWEMEAKRLITVESVEAEDHEYDRMRRQWTGAPVEDFQVEAVAELSPKLRYPQQIVAVASVKAGGENGSLVLDGPRSRFYPDSQFPAETKPEQVLKIHLGRELLGFTGQPDRRSFLKPPPPPPPPRRIIKAYERLVQEARRDPQRARRLLGGFSDLGSSFDDYATALAAEQGCSAAFAVTVAYELLLAAADSAEPKDREEVFAPGAPLGDNFDTYTNALCELGRHNEVPRLIELFRPHVEHKWRFRILGRAAFHAGHDALAEELFNLSRQADEGWTQCGEVGMLAEIWLRQGRTDQAHALLVEALQALQLASRTAKGSDRQFYEKRFQNHRVAFLKLFPERGEADLERLGIAKSTLKSAG